MSDIKSTITEQMEQLQTLMHRMVFHRYMRDGAAVRTPYWGQGRVLAMLNLKPEISQKELTYLLGMSKQSLAELLSKLEKNGYISREPLEEDKRSVTIRLLEKGRKAAQDMDNDAAGVEQIFDCLNEEELTRLSEYLDRVIHRCAETFSGADGEERRHRMERFLSHNNYGFSRMDLNGGGRRKQGAE